jgi:hypothetical protein
MDFGSRQGILTNGSAVLTDCANERKKEKLKMSKDEVNKKYRGKYVEIARSYDYIKKCYQYIVLKSYGEIRENTTLGEDVGTSMEYCR